MNQPLPPPIGANRVEETDAVDEQPAVSGLSPRIRLVAAALVLALAIGAGVVGYRVITGDDDDGNGSGAGVRSWSGQELGPVAFIDRS